MLRHLGLRPLWRAVLCVACLVSEPVIAYAFTVTPIRLDLGEATRSVVVTVANDDQLPLSFQIRLMRWSQDAQGQDRYEPSGDLIYFPRILTIEPQDKRVVRVGNVPQSPDSELSYRLYIEEMAPAQPMAGSAVAVRMRFALPVFVAPKAPRIEGQLQDVVASGKQLQFRVGNSGNRHFRIDSMRLLAGEKVLHEAIGGYVLAGVTRTFHLPLPSEACAPQGPLRLMLQGEGISLQRPLTLSATDCAP